MLEKFGLEISERAQQGAAWLNRRFPHLAGTFEGIAELAIRRGGNDAIRDLERRDSIYGHTMQPITTTPIKIHPQQYMFRFPEQDAARPDYIEYPMRGDFEDAPGAIKIKGGNHLYLFPDRNMFLSTVSHNMCGGAGDCVPRALWAVPHLGAKPYDQLLLDLQRVEYNHPRRDDDGRIIARDIYNPLSGVSPFAMKDYMNKYGNSLFTANQETGDVITDPGELSSFISHLSQTNYTGLLGVVIPESVTKTTPENHTFAVLQGLPVGSAVDEIPVPVGSGGYEFSEAHWMTRPGWDEKAAGGMRPAPVAEAKIAAAARRQGFFTNEADIGENGMPIPIEQSSFLRNYDPTLDGAVTLIFDGDIPRRND